jgi:HEAT repeat protein
LDKMAEIEELKNKLIKSHWPKCNDLANEIMAYRNEESKNALIEALKARRHHVRTAAIKALASLHDMSVVEHIKPCLNDAAYETRIEAKKVLLELTGENFATGSDE